LSEHSSNPGQGESDAVPRRVWSSTALLIAGRVWGTACTLVALGLLARHLSGENFGRFTFYLAVLILLDGVADFGTSTAALQRGAHDRWALTSALISARRVRAMAASIGWIVVVALAWLFGEDELTWIALAALAPMTRVLETSAVLFQNKIAWAIPVAIRAVVATLRLLLVFALVYSNVASYGPYLVAHASGAAISNALLYLAVRRFEPQPTIAVATLPGFFRAALPLAATGICQQAYFYIDNLFVRSFRGEVELGQYNAAVRILSFLLLVSAYATQAALPWLVRRSRAGDLKRATSRLTGPLVVVGLGGLLLIWPFADELLRAIFGAGFEAAATSLRWLLVAALVVYAGSSWLTAVVASGRTTTVLWITGGGLVVNVLGNAILVPVHGMEGAAMATVTTEIFVAAFSLAVLVRLGSRSTRVLAP